MFVLNSFSAPANLSGEHTFYADGSLVYIGHLNHHPSIIQTMSWHSGTTIHWGNGATANGVTIIVQGEGRNITIGEDCMFADEIEVRNSDMHGIVEIGTAEWLNKPVDVVVQPHVWVAQRVMIIKSPRIGYGSVIGAMSCVTRAIPPKSLAAGAPAKVIRDNITWDRADRPSQRTIDLIRSLDQIAPIDDFCETL